MILQQSSFGETDAKGNPVRIRIIGCHSEPQRGGGSGQDSMHNESFVGLVRVT